MAGSYQILNRTTLWLALITLTVMILGPLVRANDAGLACPDWPLCYGHVIPPYEFRVYLEFIHRAAVGLMSLLFLGWLGLIFTRFRAEFWKPAALAALLLTTQILLGGATITEKLEPYVVKSHLINALLFWSCLLFVWFRTRSSEPVSATKEARVLAAILYSLVFIQIYMGGRVSTNEAGLACTDFPACYRVQIFEPDGSSSWVRTYFPPMQGHVEKHMSHRWTAYALLLLGLAVLLRGRQNLEERARRLTEIIFGLLVLQTTLGILNVLYQIPVTVTVAHSAVAILLYGAAFIHLLEVARARKPG